MLKIRLSNWVENPQWVEVAGVMIPKNFTTFFFIDDAIEIGKEWTLELVVQIGDEGTPFIKELFSKAKSQKDIEAKGLKEAVSSIQARHIAFIHQHHRSFLLIALEMADLQNSIGEMKIDELRNYQNEIIRRAKKNHLTPEFLAEVRRRKIAIENEIFKNNLPNNSNIQLAEIYGYSVEAVVKWLAKEESSDKPKKISAKKAGSKKTTTKKGKSNGAKTS